ncbi:AlpA family transcriptional regulator [Massilia sp. YIM B02769]|uniref:helix-turn-helix transcriptional regulator n=1 Tax=Massilia sp. YIM B02769 TaxID=3050129 RepID=UPI0025B64695|nr:AlpA family transcriptional regulator [Massilia sp. YIM B02769]MDN4061271.1 AlpA family transcriptional regulator [Massilia sp. YIM B02769]
MNAPKKFLRLPAVIELVGIKRTVIYERIKAGTFPKPVQIGPRAVAWDQEELVKWQDSLPRGVKNQAV